MLKKHWEQLSPKAKRIAIIAGIILLIWLVTALFSSNKPNSSRPQKREEAVRHVLTDRDTRNVSLEGLSAEVRRLNNENTQNKREVAKLNKELEEVKGNEKITPKMERELAELKEKISILFEHNADQATEKATHQAITHDDDDDEPDEAPPVAEERIQKTGLEIDPSNPNSIFDSNSWPTTTLSSAVRSGVGGPPKSDSGVPSGFQIKTYEQAEEESEEDTEKNKDDSIFLPAGSILTGVFLNGIDAPTGQGARRDPFPATLRIQKEAILPNRFRADVRECFLIIAGYGDLSSERAYLRGETISCVREDGGVIESRLDSYAVGEDGKAGVRGRLVSKQGQIIAKSLMAGFLSGVSKAFDVKPIPIIDTSGNSRSYERNTMGTDWIQSAAVNGASSALDRVADFYLEMAEGMFPVIEVDAGRQIDIIISRGTSLQLKTKR